MSSAFAEELRLLTATSAFAAEVHQDQRRSGPSQEPYINHCLRVAHLLSEAGVTEGWLLQVGLLHDAVEDASERERVRAEVRARFGARVAEGVEWLTAPEGMRMVERKAHQAEVAARMPEGLRLVKLADQTDNLRSFLREPPGWKPARLLAYAEGARGIARSCSGVNEALDRWFEEAYQAVIREYGSRERTEEAPRRGR